MSPPAVRLEARAEALRIEWSRLARLRRPAAWLAVALGWPPLAFTAAGWLRLGGAAAMALAVGPAIGALVVAVPALAGALQPRVLVLRRAGGSIVVGRVAPLGSAAFSVTVTERRRWLGEPGFVLGFSALAPAGAAEVRLSLLRVELADREQAESMRREIQRFLDG